MSKCLPDIEIRALIALAKTGDILARNQVIEANYGLLYSLAIRSLYRRPSLIFEVRDLAGYGVFGMIHAIDKFDLARPEKFGTYVKYWIMQRIQEARINFEEIVPLPGYLFRIARRKDKLVGLDQHVDDDELAALLGTTRKRVGYLAAATRRDYSIHDSKLDEISEPLDTAEEQACWREAFWDAASKLSEGLRAVFWLKLEGKKCREIAKILHVSHQTIASRLRIIAAQMRRDMDQ